MGTAGIVLARNSQIMIMQKLGCAMRVQACTLQNDM